MRESVSIGFFSRVGMRRHRKFIVGNALLALSTSFVLSQEKPDQPVIFKSDARLVPLYATVVNKHGKLITDLTPAAFKVFENGVEQPIKKVLLEDVPVSLGLIIDSSGSMSGKRQKVEAAALALLRASNPEDEVFIVNFSDQANLLRDFTSDVNELERGLAELDSRGGTAMRDALSVSIEHVKKSGKKDKKVLILVTDGDDNHSRITLKNLIGRLQRNQGVVVYTVGLLAEEDRHRAKEATRALKAIAVASGGVPYLPKGTDDMEKICQQIARDIRSQYIIEYTPLNAALDGSFRQIKVSAAGPNQPTVRTRTGYYATPEHGDTTANLWR